MTKPDEQAMKTILSKLRPPHYLYLVLHVVMFFLGIVCVQLGGALWAGAGSSLVATAVAGWVIFVYMFQAQSVSDRLNLLTTFGLKDAFDSRSVSIKNEYATRLHTAADKIDVLGFGLRALREDFSESFAKWSQRAQVRILLLDPEYPSIEDSYAEQRDLEEKNPENTIRTDVREFIKASSSLLRSRGGRFKIRLYTCLPSINIFRIDEECFWGPYLVGGQSRNLPTFLVESGGVLFDRLQGHFNEIWNDNRLSRPVPDEWHTIEEGP